MTESKANYSNINAHTQPLSLPDNDTGTSAISISFMAESESDNGGGERMKDVVSQQVTENKNISNDGMAELQVLFKNVKMNLTFSKAEEECRKDVKLLIISKKAFRFLVCYTIPICFLFLCAYEWIRFFWVALD